jgi:hypothetical protein
MLKEQMRIVFRSAFTAAIFAAASIVASLVGCGAAPVSTVTASNQPPMSKPTVAAIYFPSWHVDDHYSSWYGEGWNEYRLLAENPERFPGHHRIQPAKDWGYFDEADPKWMARQIDQAAQFGVDVFIFDWYWYSGVQILHRPVEEALPKTPNRDKIKYALMWANHPWIDYFPVKYEGEPNWLFRARHSTADFDRVIQHCIERHFNQPNYWRVNGGAYFSLFIPEDLMTQVGGPQQCKAMLTAAREKVRKAGLGEVHFAGFTGNHGNDERSIPNLEAAGFDSVTGYNLNPMSADDHKLPERPFEEYDHLVERHEELWDRMSTGNLPYAPVVTVGWDATARWEKGVPWPPTKNAYPYSPTAINNTPEKFGGLVRRGLRQMEEAKVRPPFLLINAWNEWTEGASLLPQEKYGNGYLEALKKALAAGPLPRQTTTAPAPSAD